MYKCEICGKEFEKYNQLRGHMAVHAKRGEKAPADQQGVGDDPPPEGVFKCEICGKEFKSEASLKAHINGFHHRREKAKEVDMAELDELKKQIAEQGEQVGSLQEKLVAVLGALDNFCSRFPDKCRTIITEEVTKGLSSIGEKIDALGKELKAQEKPEEAPPSEPSEEPKPEEESEAEVVRHISDVYDELSKHIEECPECTVEEAVKLAEDMLKRWGYKVEKVEEEPAPEPEADTSTPELKIDVVADTVSKKVVEEVDGIKKMVQELLESTKKAEEPKAEEKPSEEPPKAEATEEKPPEEPSKAETVENWMMW